MCLSQGVSGKRFLPYSVGSKRISSINPLPDTCRILLCDAEIHDVPCANSCQQFSIMTTLLFLRVASSTNLPIFLGRFVRYILSAPRRNRVGRLQSTGRVRNAARIEGSSKDREQGHERRGEKNTAQGNARSAICQMIHNSVPRSRTRVSISRRVSRPRSSAIS